MPECSNFLSVNDDFWKMMLFTIQMRATAQLAVLCLLFLGQNVTSEAPHIIFMLIDDLGWNDVSFHGSVQIPTPNIDTLAFSGVVLNNYYVQPLCTPSRGSLMTGKYPIKLGLQHNVIYASEPWGLSPQERILPQYLKELGYATHGVGKWHLGFFQSDYLPSKRGFDSFFGYWTGKEDYFTHFELEGTNCGLDFHHNADSITNYTGYYGTGVFTNQAKNIIKTHNSSQPLFLYIAHQAVHAGNSDSPLQAPLEFVKKFIHIKDDKRRRFAGMASALDKSVGEVVTALDEADMLRNSIIIFSADNGGAVEGIDDSTGSNWPLRGSKYSMWEGGVRGAAFIWSPLMPHSRGYISEDLIHISDWLPTLYAAAGGDLHKLGAIDGYNLWSSIIKNSSSPRDHVLLNIDPEWKVEAIRKGQYKLLRGSVFNGEFDGWFDKEGKKQENIPFEEEDLQTQKQIYRSELTKSEVFQILLKKYSKIFDVGCIGNCSQQAEVCESEQEHSSNLYKVSKDVKKAFPHFFGQPVEVHCGQKPANASTNCQPLKEACLFDIKKDPCEYNNLANSLSSVVQELEELLNKYRVEAVPIRNTPADPKANPKYHGYQWVPWTERHVKI